VKRRWLIGAGVCGLVVAGSWYWGAAEPDALSVVVRRGTLVSTLTVSGTLRPVDAPVYRSPLVGREAEIVFLAPEGTRVADLVAQLDTTELERDRDRLTQELRQAQMEAQVAEIDWQVARGAIDDLEAGQGALTVEESQARLERARRKAVRLRQELAELEPLMARGFLTRDEFARTADALDQAEEELRLASRRAEVLATETRPREQQQASLVLAQKAAQREHVRARLRDVEARVALVAQQIESCSLFARAAGLVVHESFMNASAPRKIRVGDRVTASQGIVTIPEVARMVVETSASERDMHRLRVGQTASISLEAYPDVRLAGRVLRVGTLARQTGSADDKRFDLLIEVDPGDVDVRPEMTARADVRLAERTGVLLVPINAVAVADGLSVATVAGRQGLETRVVRLGETSDTMAEVIEGLAEGERVSLDARTDLPSAAPAPTPEAAGRNLADVARTGAVLAPR
jgi:HlyD family secretion protein